VKPGGTGKLSQKVKQRLLALIDGIDVHFSRDIGIGKQSYSEEEGGQMQALSFAFQDLVAYTFLDSGKECGAICLVSWEYLVLIGTNNCNNEIANNMRTAVRNA
jgi:hypothetical protein